MMENIVVGLIIVAAAAFAGYRLLFRPSCGCGNSGGACRSGCGCSGGNPRKDRSCSCEHGLRKDEHP